MALILLKLLLPRSLIHPAYPNDDKVSGLKSELHPRLNTEAAAIIIHSTSSYVNKKFGQSHSIPYLHLPLTPGIDFRFQ